MDKRTAIILGVWRVILERGISGVSMRSVADAADVSLGLVQHYHRSKDELIRASAEAMIAGAAIRYGESPSPRDAVRHLVTHAIPTTKAFRDGVVIWHAYLAACVADEGLARLLRDAKDGQERELVRHLSGILPDDAAQRVARTVIALADGLSARVITGDLSGTEAVDTALSALDDLAGPWEHRLTPPAPSGSS